jgi:hypothetical protein
MIAAMASLGLLCAAIARAESTAAALARRLNLLL